LKLHGFITFVIVSMAVLLIRLWAIRNNIQLPAAGRLKQR
jgi:hypothetical protein